MFRQCILTKHSDWKWSTQLWMQNFDDECYERTLCLFLAKHAQTQNKRKYFHLNSIDIHKYSGRLVIRIPGWSGHQNGTWEKLYSTMGGMGEAWRGSLSLFLPSIVRMWSRECCSSLSLLFCHYTEVIKYPVDLEGMSVSTHMCSSEACDCWEGKKSLSYKTHHASISHALLQL
jgi:hypothetical protein